MVGWLLLVAAAFTVGQRLGVANTNAYDPGQAGQAERVLNEPGVQQPDHESVLIRAHSLGQAFGNDPQMRQATQGRRHRAAAGCPAPRPTSARRSPPPA